MDFCIETKELQRIVKLLGVTARTNTTSFEGRVLIEAFENGNVVFTSIGSSTSITVSSKDNTVHTPGSEIILFGKVKSFVNALHPWNGESGTKELSFVGDGDKELKVSVKTIHENGKKSSGKLQLRLLKDMSFRKPKPFGKPNFILNSNMLKKAISNIIYSVDRNEARVFIQGINITFKNNDLLFVCTNGLTLSEYKVNNPGDLKEGVYILKHEFVMGLRHALGEETQIYFEIEGNDIRAQFDNVCFYGKLVIGHDYPTYSPILDKFSNVIVVDKTALMDVLSPFMDLLNVEDNKRITFELKDRNIRLYNDEVSYDCDFNVDYDGEFVVDVNGDFLFQTIDAIDDDSILIKFTDENNVVIFDSGNFENQKALITPVRRR